MLKAERLLLLVKGIGDVRWIILVSVGWFAFFFNIERLDFTGSDPFNFSNMTYAIALGLGLTLLAFPNLAQLDFLQSAVFVVIVFTLANVLFASNLLEREFHLYVLEAVCLVISLGLLRRVSIVLLDFEISLDTFVFNKERTRTLSYPQGQAKVNQELDRATRFNRNSTLIYCSVYKPEFDELAAETERQGTAQAARHYMLTRLESRHNQVRLASFAAALIHKSDLIIEYGEALLVYLTEASPEEARTFIWQLNEFVQTNTDQRLLTGIATFPKDGRRLNDLAAASRGNVRIYQADEEFTPERPGDVIVDIEQRMRIEEAADWVNKMAYQSTSTRLIYEPIKRLMDIGAVLAVSPLMVPLLSLVALLIYLDDKGPIFYMQNRTGQGGKRFRMYKFRSMSVGAKALPPKEVITASGEVRYEWPEKTKDDQRITRIGKFIRKTSVDELPQLLNVLRGDMSLVGPRPTTWDVDMYTLLQTERLRVRPGITGLWQVCARESKNMDERLIWDMKYVEKMSLYLDLIIIWRTVMQVFKKGGV